MSENEVVEKRYVPMTEEQKRNRLKLENKILVCLFAILILTLSFPAIKRSINREVEVGGDAEGYYYYGTNKGITIYEISEGEVPDVLEIPGEIDGYPVVAITEEIFRYRNNLVEVYIPDSVTNIDRFTFADCENLEYVELPEELKILGVGAFDDCPKLNRIVIPDGVERITTWAFSDCYALTEIVLSENITVIEEAAFETCTGLTEIRLPEAVTEIHPNAFSGCTNLKTVYAPEGSYAAAWARERGYEVITE